MKLGRFEKSGKIINGVVEANSQVKVIKGNFFQENIEFTGEIFNLDEMKVLAPILPSSMLALAKNYGSHLQGEDPPKQPEPFYKTTSSLSSHLDKIIIPKDSKRVDAESELVVVIGKVAKNVEIENVFDHILGYTCGNDVSARDWQKEDKSWWRAKSSDSFSPIGPFIETEVDPENLQITGRINGEEVQSCKTSEMIWSIPKTIEFITKYVTLYPGDCIFTGTSGTAGQIVSGDKVEIEIENIGILINTCI